MNTPNLHARVRQTTLELLVGDITEQETDAIVNAANTSLLGGGGVDGAIHRAAGPGLLAETRALGGCPTGDAKISRGYRLKARCVIHAVGPVYRPRDAAIPALLQSAYRRSLEVAAENSLRSLSFPAISTGIYGYPLAEAAPLALQAVYDFCQWHDEIELVRFVLFTESAYRAFAEALDALIRAHDDARYEDRNDQEPG